MATVEADYLLHLGDFIYESAIAPLRRLPLPSGASYASSREDLLTIYRAHRSDADLRAGCGGQLTTGVRDQGVTRRRAHQNRCGGEHPKGGPATEREHGAEAWL